MKNYIAMLLKNLRLVLLFGVFLLTLRGIYIIRYMATAIDISAGGTMSQVDALWTLIQGQKKAVRQALVKRIIESDAEEVETARQKARIRKSIEKGWSEVKNSMQSGKELKSAEELLRELRAGQ